MKPARGGKGPHEADEDGIVVVEVPEESAATIPSTTELHHDKKKKNRINPDLPPYKLNPRWRGYCLIALFSMICLGSVRHVKSYRNVEKNELMKNSFDGNPRAGMAFGSLSLAITILVLLHEYIQRCISQFEQRGVDSGFHDAQALDYKVLLGGKVEGGVLALLVLLWSIGLGYLTQVNGIAYAGSMNVYCSAWLSFAACLYTFFDWIQATSIQWEKRTAATRNIMFPTWCLLALSSLVVMGTSIEILVTQNDSIMNHDDQYVAEAAYGISWGFLSLLACVLWIVLVGRDNRGDSGNGSPRPNTTPAAAAVAAAAAAAAAPNSRQKWSTREWMELILILVCLLLWIVATALFTRPQGLAATIMGQHLVTNSGTAEQDATLPANALTTDMFYKVPGSNLYLGVWTCFGASLYLLHQWSMEPHQQPPAEAAAEQRPQPQQEQRALPQQHPVGQKKRQQPQHNQRGPPLGQDQQQQQQRRRSPQPQRKQQQQQRRPPTSGHDQEQQQQQRKRRPPPPAGERQQQQRPTKRIPPAKATAQVGQVKRDEPNEHGPPQPPPNKNDRSRPTSLGGESDIENDDIFVDAQED